MVLSNILTATSNSSNHRMSLGKCHSHEKAFFDWMFAEQRAVQKRFTAW